MLDDRGSIPDRNKRFFLLSLTSSPAFGPSNLQSSGYWKPFLRAIKWPFTLSRTEVKKDWNFASTTPYTFTKLCLIGTRDAFACTSSDELHKLYATLSPARVSKSRMVKMDRLTYVTGEGIKKALNSYFGKFQSETLFADYCISPMLDLN
jgi:hypothetical protein